MFFPHFENMMLFTYNSNNDGKLKLRKKVKEASKITKKSTTEVASFFLQIT